MQVVRGGGMISRERKKDRMRNPWRPAGRSVPFGGAVRWQGRTRVHEAGYSDGRTIALGEFEFARMEIGLEACGIEREALVEAMRAIASEWLDQEEARITGVPREPQPFAALPGVRRRLRLGYGLTLRGEGKRETIKFDVHLCDPIPDGASVGEAIEGARQWLEARIREERAVAQDEKPEEGL
jgi:hypothetical protein